MVKVELNPETLSRIHDLRGQLKEEMDMDCDVEELINIALTALEDARNG